MRILVTGANGQLGNEMQVLAKENPQHTYYFTDVQELDICDKQAVWTYMAAVSYPHLTLPTICSVSSSVVAASL